MSSQNSSRTLSSMPSQTQPSTSTPHHALELNDILEEIFSHIHTPQELVQYRGVSQKWNAVIVHILDTKWKNFFPIRLRYGREVPLSLNEPEAEAWTSEILEFPPMLTLTGTTTHTPLLSFDSVVVDNDFYLAGVNREWEHFLKIYGESIRHLKFNIRSREEPEENSHHVNCDQIVSKENLRTAFYAINNLESLDFCIAFTDSRAQGSMIIPERMFPQAREVTDLPQLKKLTKITIREPRGVQYSGSFLNEILVMAPNLTTLDIKYSRDLSQIASALRALPHLNHSLTTLGMTMTYPSVRFSKFEIQESGFSRFHLTKLELNRITGNMRHLEEFLQSQSSTLITLILADKVIPNIEPRSYHSSYLSSCVHFVGTSNHQCRLLYYNPLTLPSRMDSLKILEVNLSKFNLAPIITYTNHFPALKELTTRNCEEKDCFWSYMILDQLLPGENGRSHTVMKFTLHGLRRRSLDGTNIIHRVRSTFPLAEHLFPV